MRTFFKPVAAAPAPVIGDLTTRVRRELLNMVYHDQPFSLAAGWLYALAISIIIVESQGSRLPWLWLAGMTLLLGSRAVMAYRYLAAPPGAAELGQWERRLFVGAVLTAVFWGTIAWYAYPIASPVLQGAVLLLIGGLIAATSRTIACHLPTYSTYAIVSATPLIACMLRDHNRASTFLGWFGVLFVIMMIGVGRSFRDTVARSFRLQFENADLAAQLQRDIAGREAAEAALRASEERLRFAQYALDHAQDLVAIMDRSGNLLHASDALRRHTGRSAEELATMKAWAGVFAMDAEQFGARWEQVKHTGATTFETEVLARGGERKPVEVNASYVEFNGREAVCTIARDLVARRAAEQEKMRLLQQLQETQKLESLGVLAGGIAHDFNNLLTAILANASLARENIEGSPAVGDMLGQIEHAATQAAGLCRQMLAYAGRGQLAIEPLDLSALVSDSAKLLEMTVGRRARLELRLETSLPPVLGDASQVRQILINLVHNAAEAIIVRDGRIIVTTARVRIDRRMVSAAQVRTAVPDGEGVALTVADNGEGMDRETLERIFEPFFTTKFTGRGLGLAAVLGIVRSHRGLLLVESESRRGSTFRLVLPVPETVPTKPPAAANPGARRSGCILVVDDEDTVRKVARQTLQRVGYVVDTVVDGDAAVAAVAEHPGRYDLLLVDMTMPGMDGIATLRELRRRGTTTPAIIMSGFSEQQVRERTTTDGIADFLQKPFDTAALRAKVQAVLGVSQR